MRATIPSRRRRTLSTRRPPAEGTTCRQSRSSFPRRGPLTPGGPARTMRPQDLFLEVDVERDIVLLMPHDGDIRDGGSCEPVTDTDSTGIAARGRFGRAGNANVVELRDWVVGGRI